nr:MAG TPA: hypothetical protein [Caudoviricetes sp.]
MCQKSYVFISFHRIRTTIYVPENSPELSGRIFVEGGLSSEKIKFREILFF